MTAKHTKPILLIALALACVLALSACAFGDLTASDLIGGVLGEVIDEIIGGINDHTVEYNGLKLSLNSEGKGYSVVDAVEKRLGSKVVIPSTYNGLPITSICGYANVDGDDFDELDGLSFCESIVEVVIPDTVTSIGDVAFSYCTSLRKVNIPDSVTEIGIGAFAGCENLANLTIPDSVKEIGIGAFAGCNAILDIIVPDSVNVIDEGAFATCEALKSVTLSANLTSISESLFFYCKSLTSVVIPKGVVIIQGNAFENCSALTEIHFGGTKEEWAAINKGTDWDKDTGSYTVYCTDGEIAPEAK